MSGVYIPNWKKPEGYCPFIHADYSECTIDPKNKCSACHFVPVSDHFRLIDVNAVKRYLSNCAKDRGAIRPLVSWEEAFDEIVGVLEDFTVNSEIMEDCE